MALETTVNRVAYAGNGVTTAFSFPYYFLAEADLVVISRNDTTGVETTKTLTTHYTITGEGEEAGGTVTMLTAPASGTTLVIYRDPAIKQESDWRENDSLPAEQTEQAHDKAAMISQRLKDRVDRSVRLSDGFSPTFDPTLPVDLDDAGDKIPLVNSAGTGWADAADWPDVAGVTASMAASAAAAAASAAAAATSETAAELAETNAETAETNAETAENNAETAESNAAASASAAAASAAAAASTLASALWRGVVRLTFASSPYTVLPADNGKLHVIDTSGGAVVINLPSLAAVALPTNFGFKLDAGANGVTINRNGTDTIDGATSYTLQSNEQGVELLGTTDGAPDDWETVAFGAATGNLTVDRFSGDGSDVTFDLSVTPVAEENTQVFIDGVYQQKNTYSLSGATITFSTAPPLGVNNIEVVSGTTLSIGTPSDGTVTNAKFAPMNNNTIKGNVSGGSAVPTDLTGTQAAGIFTAPTRQHLTATNGVYTTPAGCKWIRVRLVGAGGGGNGGNASGGIGGAGGQTSFGAANLLVATGGQVSGSNNSPGEGGTTSINSPASGFGWTGARAQHGGTTATLAGNGASSPFGGAGSGGFGGAAAGLPAKANTGSGGGGGGAAGGQNCGAGGSAGGFIEAIITSPDASYTYAVGTGGTAGSTGTGAIGGAGGSGVIIVEEFYV